MINGTSNGGNLIISTAMAIKRLGISKAGLYKWINQGHVKQRVYSYRGRIYKGFKDTEIDALSRKLNKKEWSRGKSLLR